MEMRQNFGTVVWILPFYGALSLGYFFPAIFGYAFILGLAATIGGLFVQVKLNEWMAREFNLIRLEVDGRPRTVGKSPSTYRRWPTITQIWTKGEPKCVTDSYGWTTAWVHALNGGYRHPSYNRGDKLYWLQLRFRGSWADNIKFFPGSGVFRGSVVDLPNVSRVWCTEIVADSLPDLTGRSQRELLTLTPPAIRDDDGVLKFVPKLIVRRAEGTIDMELEQYEKDMAPAIAPVIQVSPARPQR